MPAAQLLPQICKMAAAQASRQRIRGVVFDLDGTLCDSMPAICTATNHALQQLGHNAIPEAEFKHVGGGGNQIFMTNALRHSTGATPSPAEVNKAVALKMAFEVAHGEKDNKEFTGATQALAALSVAGLQLAVLSNKAEPLVHKAVAHCFPSVPWVAVCGARDDTPFKPSPIAALRIVERHMPGVEPTECAFVGDTTVDMQTAVAAGMFPVGVAWGFHDEEELVCNGAKAVARERMDIVKILQAQGN